MRLTQRLTQRLLLASLLGGSVACTSQETKRCHAEMITAQEVVKGIESSSIQSVERALSAVDAALAACVRAERDHEVGQLRDARTELAAHKKRLEQHVSTKASAKLTPAELDALVAAGDPSCPRGQAYKHGDSGREVSCTGPQPIAMSYAQAKEFYAERGFKLKEHKAPPGFEAEYGSEKYVFRFGDKRANAAPVCLTIYPQPGMSWQEVVARMTGARMDRLQGKSSVETPRGAVPLRVDQGEDRLIVYLGRCEP